MRISDWSSDVCSSDLADIAARIEFGAALAHEDVARNGDFAAELLHAETTACRIATVARRTACFFMCHCLNSFALRPRSEEHTSELQSLMRISYAVFFLKKKKTIQYIYPTTKQV